MIFFIFMVFFSNYGVGAANYVIGSDGFLTSKPSWLKVCRRNDPNLNQCMLNLLEDMFPILARGVPELGIEQYEPLHLDTVSIRKGNGPIVLQGSLSDMEIQGSSNSTPTFAKLNLEDKKWDYGIDIPSLKIKARYQLKGHILVLPLVGHGSCDIQLSDVKTKIFTNFKMPLRNGREVIEIDNMKVDFSVGSMTTTLYNLFNGNKVLGDTVNNFVNKHSLEIVKELEDSINDSVADIFINLMNQIFKNIPTDFWLLTDEQFAEYEKKNTQLKSSSR